MATTEVEEAEARLVDVEPSCVQFQSVLEQRSVRLTSVSERRAAFRVRTSAPDCYVVKPSSGFLEPRQAVDVALQLHSVRPSEQHTFLVEAMVVDADAADRKRVWLQLDDAAPRQQWRIPVKVPRHRPPPSRTADEQQQHLIVQLEARVRKRSAENEQLRGRIDSAKARLDELQAERARDGRANTRSSSPPPPPPSLSPLSGAFGLVAAFAAGFAITTAAIFLNSIVRAK